MHTLRTLLVAAGLTAIASTANAQTIQACYVKNTGTVYRIKAADAPAKCSPNHTPFEWSVTAITPGFYVSSGKQSFSQQTVNMNMPCADWGDAVVAGGFAIDEGTGQVRVLKSEPMIAAGTTTPIAWNVVATNSDNSTWYLTVHVICAKATN